MNPTPILKQPRLLAMAGLAFCVFFWAGNTVIARGMVDAVPPMALSFYRWMIALVCLLPFSYRGLFRERAMIRKNWGYLFLLAIPSVGLYNSLLYLGALYTSATNISLVVAAMPTISLGLVLAVLKERPRPAQIAGICVALAGMVVIICQGALKNLSQLSINPGDLLILGAITAWALYSVMLKKKVLPISGLTFLTMTVVFGLVAISPFYLYELVFHKGFAVTGQVVGMFVYLGIFPSILSFLFWNNGVKVLGAATTSVFIYLLPVFTTIMAYFFLDERLMGFHIWGGSLIFAGLILSTWPSKKR